MYTEEEWQNQYAEKSKKKLIMETLSPQLLDLVTDFLYIVNKWNVKKIADTLGVTKEALHYHIRKKGNHERNS